MSDAATTLYPLQPSGPVIGEYRQAESSSTATPAPDPAAKSGETSAAEPRSAAMVLYGDGGAKMGNAIAMKSEAPSDVVAAESKHQDGQLAVVEPKAAPEVTEELPATLKATRWQGPTPGSVVDYEASIAPTGQFEKGADYESAKAALLAGGVPITAAIAVMDIVKDFARNGASNHTAESATKTLEAWAPGQSAQLIANARAMIDKMQKGWPQLRAELAKTNLDNSPRLVYALSQIYAARSRR